MDPQVSDTSQRLLMLSHKNIHKLQMHKANKQRTMYYSKNSDCKNKHKSIVFV